MIFRQPCLIQTNVVHKYLSGLGKIRIMSIGPSLDENPDNTCPD